MRTLVIVAVVAALLLGCQQSRPTNPLAPPMGPAVRTLTRVNTNELARSGESEKGDFRAEFVNTDDFALLRGRPDAGRTGRRSGR